ncbi:NADH-quinone oxidoreductase subunit L [Paludifilum halophilum]|uniref:NADH-quinone oxidoreductase subunit L n=1 Tax=Paludifilum halophilum TaxID=1642702 RepID=A0A235B717_9BACL|nr:NADH-quinone oxidoreductase subunit L [Paludifilum halophilum]OYD08022.1 NADH-quinone oxidoreductase subunit L [Paludifilum halophilum]
MLENAWTIPLFPLVAFFLLLFGRKSWGEKAAAWVGSLAAFASLAVSAGVLAERLSGAENSLLSFSWLTLGETVIRFGIEVDPLNALMLLIVSLISFLVHVYSYGYMKGDGRVPVFYAYLSLFTFSMLGLVVSANLLQLYIFWELVGVCSFLLIGFWYFKPEAKQAAKKAFVVTRIGDIGLFLALLLAFWYTGSLELGPIFAAVEAGQVPAEMVTLIAVLIFVGAIGKSGQFPLHTWLPDAMEGPTPVSALIHAATMVAAGVYLVARTFPLFEASPVALDTVAYVGAFTAIFAASIGLVQNDIKRVLAYSTVSQLGYMMLALGSAGYAAGAFHLMTHAFFKALLFLAAGAVIVALHHQQDIRKMGGLWSTHPGIGWLFLIGCLAISGIPPFSGFFSKDEVLASAWMDGRPGVFAVGVVAAFFTAFYMFRLFFLVFTGSFRGEGNRGSVPKSMLWPMGILAVPAVAAGFVEYPTPFFSRWLTEGTGLAAEAGGTVPLWLPVLATLASLAGVALAWAMYVKRVLPADDLTKPIPWGYRLLKNKYFIDEIYAKGVVLPYRWLGAFLRGFDRFVVSGLVRFSAGIFRTVGRIGSAIQNGQAQTYALVSLVGLVLLIIGLTAGRLFG